MTATDLFWDHIVWASAGALALQAIYWFHGLCERPRQAKRRRLSASAQAAEREEERAFWADVARGYEARRDAMAATLAEPLPERATRKAERREPVAATGEG